MRDVPALYTVPWDAGRPALITLRALETLHRAALVVADRAIPPDLRNLALRRGRWRTTPSTPIAWTRLQRKTKSADPIAWLHASPKPPPVLRHGAAANLRARVVPIPSLPPRRAAAVRRALARAGCAGAPLAVVWTAREARLGLDRRAVAIPRRSALVLDSDGRTLRRMIRQLRQAGIADGTPAVVVARSHREPPPTSFGTIATLLARLRLRRRVTVVVGRTPPPGARTQRALPLRGVRVVLARLWSPSDPEPALRQLGAQVVRVPVIRIQPIRFRPPAWERYAWIAFTSATAADLLLGRTYRARLPKIAVVGPGTAAAVRRWGHTPHCMPRRSTVRDLARLLKSTRGRILHPCADIRSPDLRAELDGRVDELVVYRIRAARPRRPRLRPGDIVALASSETARRFAQLAAPAIRVVAIGPRTARTARSLGLPVVAVARRHDFRGLVRAIVEAAR